MIVLFTLFCGAVLLAVWKTDVVRSLKSNRPAPAVEVTSSVNSVIVTPPSGESSKPDPIQSPSLITDSSQEGVLHRLGKMLGSGQETFTAKELHEKFPEIKIEADLFLPGTADLQPSEAAVSQFKRLVDQLQKHPQATVTIEGHVRKQKSKDAAMKLSSARAEAVKNWLVRDYGVFVGRLTAVGYGDSKPLVKPRLEGGPSEWDRTQPNERVVCTIHPNE